MKLKKSFLNVFIGIGSQIIIMCLAIVIPRFVLTNYGSEVNGLFNSVSQIYSYIVLLESGVGAATLQTLYKYIDKGSKSDISSIISSAHGFYKKISYVYIACVFVVGFLFSVLTDSSINRVYIFLIFLLQGISGVVNFRFIAAEKLILTVEGKNYITNGVATITSIVTSIGKIILVNLQINIVLLQTFYCMVTIGQLLFYYIYFKKKYGWLDLKAPPNKEALYQKKYFMITEISWTAFSCTPMVLLSFFCDFKIVSVYAIYNLVFSSLSTLLNTVYYGTQFVLSREYHQSKEKYILLHDSYDCCFDFLIFASMAICYVMILPFIKLYTAGISDINYIDKYLPFLFCLVQLLSWIRYVSGNLVNISGHVNKVTKISIAETVINIVVSVVLVNFIGIYGVLIGTSIALLLKSNYLIVYANKAILQRSAFQTYKTVAVNFLLFVLVMAVASKIDLYCDNYFQWLIRAICCAAVIIIVFLIGNVLANIKLFKFILTFAKSLITSKLKVNKKPEVTE